VKLTGAAHVPITFDTGAGFEGQPATGFSVSFTVTVNVQVCVLLDASVAVTTTVVAPTLNELPDAGKAALVTPAQLSEDDGKVNVTGAAHVPVTFDTGAGFIGQAATGASVSFTVTVNVQVTELEEASVVVTVTVVVPTVNELPETGEATAPTPGQLSVGESVNVTGAAHVPVTFDTGAGFAGQPATGFSVSFTVTVNVQVTELEEASVVVTVTVVAPTVNELPEA
jgi:predicted secreted Zn-dependent protease